MPIIFSGKVKIEIIPIPMVTPPNTIFSLTLKSSLSILSTEPFIESLIVNIIFT